MLYRCTGSILVCKGSIVASFLADVLCTAGGNLCGRFTSVAIRKASSPAHGKIAVGSAYRKWYTKGKDNCTKFEQGGR